MANKKAAAGELPGIVGKGVAPVSIPKINKLCDVYVAARDSRMSRLKDEVEAKTKLVDAIHDHIEQIGEDSNGEVVYRYEDTVITLKPGEEKLKVKAVGSSGEGDEE
jgi:hypothetical protein